MHGRRQKRRRRAPSRNRKQPQATASNRKLQQAALRSARGAYRCDHPCNNNNNNIPKPPHGFEPRTRSSERMHLPTWLLPRMLILALLCVHTCAQATRKAEEPVRNSGCPPAGSTRDACATPAAPYGTDRGIVAPAPDCVQCMYVHPDGKSIFCVFWSWTENTVYFEYFLSQPRNTRAVFLLGRPTCGAAGDLRHRFTAHHFRERNLDMLPCACKASDKRMGKRAQRGGNEALNAAQAAATARKAAISCEHYADGRCEEVGKGRRCGFSHEGWPEPCMIQCDRPVKDGKCKYGETCQYYKPSAAGPPCVPATEPG